jgi:hypothetical protein
MGPRHRQNGGQGSGGNGTWDAAGGHVYGTWPPRVARSYPPFATQRNLLNQTTRKSQYVPKRKAYLLLLPRCALDEGFKGRPVVRSGCHRDFEISRFLEGAPTEEPRPDARNARSQRPATRATGVSRDFACVLINTRGCPQTGALHCPGHPPYAGA